MKGRVEGVGEGCMKGGVEEAGERGSEGRGSNQKTENGELVM